MPKSTQGTAHQSGTRAPDVPVSWAMSVPRLAKSVGGLCGARSLGKCSDALAGQAIAAEACCP